MAEGAPLLREYGLIPIEGSNPSLSARQKKGGQKAPFLLSSERGFEQPRWASNSWFDEARSAEEQRSEAQLAPQGRGP